MKERVTVSIEKKLLKVVDKEIKIYVYANRSHALEFLVAEEMRKDIKTRGGKK